jgi:3-hydroxy-9,10-secoandrosta-1,3,5(10)-triene-9,17-dione monooxygenase
LRERAPKCEQLRRLPDETLRDFHDAQLFRIHQPKRVGGAELEFAAVVTYGALFARACASTAWNWVNFAAHHRCSACSRRRRRTRSGGSRATR